jgi:hypothetical protein
MVKLREILLPVIYKANMAVQMKKKRRWLPLYRLMRMTGGFHWSRWTISLNRPKPAKQR